MLDMAKARGVEKVFVHCFLDGRDVPPRSGAGYVARLQKKCEETGNARIATVQGRFWGMDRDKRWDRVERGYNAIVCGEGVRDGDAVHAVEASYAADVTDEFVEPVVVCPEGAIGEGDSVIFMNFRPDRAREMTWALNLPDFDGFARKKTVFPLSYVCTAQYDETLTLPIAYPPEVITNTLGDLVSERGLRQFRVAETEKYAHVTFFFNGGVEAPYPGEDRILVASPKVATYDLQPEMSAYEVTDRVLERIEANDTDLIIMNLANCDMVGHTGVFEAAVAAVEAVDSCVGKIAAAIEKVHGDLIITADHGNADIMVEDGHPMTAHTSNPVPVILVSGQKYGLTQETIQNSSECCGALCDLAPTLLQLMGLPQPPEMQGKSLLV
jgi:2,3-bisphosphoglycerate-independent phosphoglycerate mutase